MAQPQIDTLATYVTDYLAGTQGLADKRQEIVSFIAGGSIAAGDAVAFDTTQTTTGIVNVVVKAGVVATGNPLAVGVALGAASYGGVVQVVVAGLHPSANVLTGVTAGTALIAGKTTAGRLADIAAASTAPACAVCLATAASNLAPVWVIKSY